MKLLSRRTREANSRVQYWAVTDRGHSYLSIGIKNTREFSKMTRSATARPLSASISSVSSFGADGFSPTGFYFHIMPPQRSNDLDTTHSRARCVLAEVCPLPAEAFLRASPRRHLTTTNECHEGRDNHEDYADR